MFSFFYFRITHMGYAFLFLLFVQHHYLKAQDASNPWELVRDETGKLIQHLDKSQIPTGYLHEYGYLSFFPHELSGVRNDTNIVQPLKWHLAYASLYSAHVHGSQMMPHPASVQASIAPYQPYGTAIALPILLTKFAIIRTNAEADNLLLLSNERYYDVPNRSQSPYLTQRGFAVSTTREVLEKQSGEFVFKTDLFYSNYGLTPLNVQSLQADLGDGQGWRNMSWNIPAATQYATGGVKKLLYKITLVGGEVFEGHSLLGVKPEPQIAQRYGTVADATMTVVDLPHQGGLTASIVYSKNNNTNPRKLRKPLIVVEDFDEWKIAPHIKGKNNDLGWFVDNFLKVQINDINNPDSEILNDNFDDISSYDLIFVDFLDATTDIRRNAQGLTQLISDINLTKVDMPMAHAQKMQCWA